MNYVVADLECDGFNPTKIHCLSMNWGGEIRTTTDYDDMRSLLTRDDIVLVGHHFIGFDIPVAERILGIKVTADVIDTWGLGLYLYSDVQAQGLADWGERFGVPKPEVEDWDNQPIEVYKHRATEDVKINTMLFEKQWKDLNELYPDEANRDALLRYISFKMYTLRLQQLSPFKLDVKRCEANLAELEGLRDEKLVELKKAMPTVGVVTKKSRPKNLYKRDGSLSAHGERWKKLCDERGVDIDYDGEIEVVRDYDEPNPQSPQQLKDWLFSLGWKPSTFTDGANGKVPQIYTQDKSICPSVLKLNHPAIEHLDNLGILKHRIGLLKGFLRDQQDGYIKQALAGFTSTMRLRHRYIVNLPKPSVPFGKYIREVLTCDDGYEICGSDLASLEDRTKQHYIYPYDPEYVKSMMTEGFDPHLSFAVFAGALTQQQADAHKRGEQDFGEIRHKYKQVNYMATYNVGATKLADYLDIKKREAKKMLDDYWRLNNSVKSFASDCEVKQCIGKKWILNPVNGFWYELRSDKDRFSAVNQSTGAYIFDLWLGYIFKKYPRLTLQMHDEGAWVIKKGHRKEFESILREAIQSVNKRLCLNREMDIDIQWGDNYACVH